MAKKLTWTTIQVKLGDLIEWDKNPVKISERDARELAKSIDRFEHVLPYVAAAPLNGKKGLPLLDGHQRKRVELTLRNVSGETLVDVRVPSRKLTEAERAEIAVRLRKNTGEFDDKKLLEWFDADDLMDWGFGKGELEKIGFEFEDAEDTLPEIDRADELLKKWKVKPGQLWELGEHRLICGDCTDEAVVRAVMGGGEKVRLCHTDPPYGVDYANVVGGRANQKAGGWHDIENDDLDNAELEEFLVKSLSLTDAPVLLCWHSWRRVEVFLSAIKRCGWKPNAEIIWVKNALVFGMSDYQWRHETCIYAKREGSGRQENRRETTVWEFDKTTGAMHPTQKPVGLFEKGLENHTKIGDVVYEPFSGSGSQIIACENLSRRCRAIEISPAYVAVTLERFYKHTNIMPKLVKNGKK